MSALICTHENSFALCTCCIGACRLQRRWRRLGRRLPRRRVTFLGAIFLGATFLGTTILGTAFFGAIGAFLGATFLGAAGREQQLPNQVLAARCP